MTIARLRAWAIALLHLGVEDFNRLRLGELLDAMRVWQEEKKAERRHIGELVRGAALRLFNLQLKAKDRITDPAKFWRMPWDEMEDDVSREIASWTQEDRDSKAKEFLSRING